MNLFPQRQQLPITLTPETEHALIQQVAEEVKEELDTFVQDFLDRGLFSGQKLAGKQRLLHYTMFTQEEDFPYLMDESYLEKNKQGLLPNLVSPRWVAAMSIPLVFEHMAKDFRHLYRALVEK